MRTNTSLAVSRSGLARVGILIASILLISGSTLGAQPDSQQSTLQAVTVAGSWQSQRGFSEAMIVNNPSRLIFLAGVGANAEGKAGEVVHPGDFMAQCRFTWDTIKRLLAREGATARNIVKITTYVTDVKNLDMMSQCRREAFDNTPPYPPHTFLTISALADPNMLIEVDVIAAATK